MFESCFELRSAFQLLFQRPDKLSLVTGEMFPAQQRKVDDEVPDAGVAQMEGVEHLGQYVFEMTKAKVEALKRGGGVLPPPVQSGVEEDEDEGEGLGYGDGNDGEVEDMEDVEVS